MAHLNYTISTVTTTESPGDSVNAGTLPSSATLIITPNSGFVASASDFNISGGTAGSGTTFSHGDTNVVLPPEVASVTFSNTGTAGQVGNTVQALVTFNHFIMPSADVELSIDINGSVTQRTINQVTACITDNVVTDGVCAGSQWPKAGDPISSTNLTPAAGTACTGNLDTVTEGTGITASSGTNANWSNPVNSVYPGQFTGDYVANTSVTTQHTGSITPNTQTTLFTKTFWTGPTRIFEATPFYQLNANAAASGYYTVEETPDNYNVDRVVLQNVSASNSVKVNLADIYPGMLVTGENITSLAPGTGYPYTYQDIRVTRVSTTNGTVSLSEKVTLTAGDTLNFNSIFDLTANGAAWGQNYPTPAHCLTKTFTVKCNMPESVDCGNHEIDFGMVPGDQIQWRENPNPLITGVNIDTSDIPNEGDTRTITIYGNGNAQFNLAIERSDGELYNFESETFGGSGPLVNQIATNATPFSRAIYFQTTDTAYTYLIRITPSGFVVEGDYSTQTQFATGVDDTYAISQYPTTTLTFAATEPSGYTTAAGLEAPGNWVVQGGATWPTGRSVISWTGTFVKDDGSVLYDNGTHAAAISLLEPGFYAFDDDGDAITADVAGDFGNATANNGSMSLEAFASGSGTATITITVNGSIYKQPTANTTVTLDIDNFIVTKPRVPNVNEQLDRLEKSASGVLSSVGEAVGLERMISVETGGSVAINLRSWDNDTNKASKTLATVVGPTDTEGTTKGSLGAHSGGSVTYTANTNITSADVGKVITFTYKGTVGAVDSDPATVYILISK